MCARPLFVRREPWKGILKKDCRKALTKKMSTCGSDCVSKLASFPKDSHTRKLRELFCRCPNNDCRHEKTRGYLSTCCNMNSINWCLVMLEIPGSTTQFLCRPAFLLSPWEIMKLQVVILHKFVAVSFRVDLFTETVVHWKLVQLKYIWRSVSLVALLPPSQTFRRCWPLSFLMLQIAKIEQHLALQPRALHVADVPPCKAP